MKMRAKRGPQRVSKRERKNQLEERAEPLFNRKTELERKTRERIELWEI